MQSNEHEHQPPQPHNVPRGGESNRQKPQQHEEEDQPFPRAFSFKADDPERIPRT